MLSLAQRPQETSKKPEAADHNAESADMKHSNRGLGDVLTNLKHFIFHLLDHPLRGRGLRVRSSWAPSMRDINALLSGRRCI